MAGGEIRERPNNVFSVANTMKKTAEVQKQNSGSIFKQSASPKNETLVDTGSKIFSNYSDSQIKRNERLRREMEKREQNPTIEDDLIEAFIGIGQGIKNKFNSFFNKPIEEQVEY